METPQIILEKALTMLDKSSINEGLNTLLQKLESKTIEEILNASKVEDVQQINNDIWKIVTNVLYSSKTDDGKTHEISDIIFTEQNYLKRGIQNIDVKLILFFLSVNCYFNIDTKSLLSKKYSFELISNKISKILLNINVDIQILHNAPYHEKEMMKKFKKGILECNIDNTYQFIEAAEKYRKNLHFHFLLEQLVSFLYQLNYSYFLEHISKIDNIQNIIIHLESFKVEQLVCLANEYSLINKWLNLEIIRQIIKKEQKNGFEENECIAIKNALFKINNTDFGFLKQTILYFHKSKLFNAGLGYFLVSLSKSQIQDIVSNCLIINQYTFNYEPRKELLKRFTIYASELQTKEFLTIIYNKWQTHFNGLKKSDAFYLNELLLTDFCDFIALFYISVTTEEDVIKQMTDIIKFLTQINSQWFVSKSKQQTMFYLYYSKLYLLSYAYKEKHLNDTCIVDFVSKIKSDNILMRRYMDYKILQSLSVIEENIRK